MVSSAQSEMDKQFYWWDSDRIDQRVKTLSSDGLVLYPGHLLEQTYTSEIGVFYGPWADKTSLQW